MIERWRRRRRRRGRSWFCFRGAFLLPAKSSLLRLTSCFSHRAKGNANGLGVLYKDMESCSEYADIRVLWEMVQSSRSLNYQNSKRSWKFCFRPN